MEATATSGVENDLRTIPLPGLALWPYLGVVAMWVGLQHGDYGNIFRRGIARRGRHVGIWLGNFAEFVVDGVFRFFSDTLVTQPNGEANRWNFDYADGNLANLVGI